MTGRVLIVAGVDDLNDFDAVMASLDPPLTIVTTACGREQAGCLVGFHAQSSIDPARYCVWLSKANRTYRVAVRSTHLGIHFLASADLPLATRFGTLSGDSVNKFAGLRVTISSGSVPLLHDCAAWLVARRTALVDEGGDHVCMVAEPEAVHTGGHFDPLRLSHAASLRPGHSN
jgi:flavin reductase (DIM6/NTAB) family NADH-FMN oxidoreductase RutF